MNERLKQSILPKTIIVVGVATLYGSLALRRGMVNDQTAIMFFIGAIILSLGLAIFDIRYNTKPVPVVSVPVVVGE